MNTDTFRVVPARRGAGGQQPGRLVRFPAGAAFLPDGSGEHGAGFVELCRSAASPWELMARVLLHMNSEQPAGHLHPFALYVAVGGQPVVVASGDVDVAVDGSPLAAPDGQQWGVWQPSAGAAVQLGRFPDSTDLEAGADIQAGLVTSTGALVLPAGTSVPSPWSRPEPAQTEEPADQAEETRQQEATPPPEPSPQQDHPQQDHPQPDHRPQPAPDTAGLAGVTEMTTAYPVIHPLEVPGDEPVGTPAAPSQLAPQASAEPPTQAVSVPATRSPVAYLVWDSGQRIALDRDVVIGRDPHGDQRVIEQAAAALVPDGVVESMSNIHAEIRLIGADILVMDRESKNGTFVWEPAASQWRRLAPNQPQVLAPGMAFAVAERTCILEPLR